MRLSARRTAELCQTSVSILENNTMTKNFPVVKFFLKKLAIYSQFYPHKSMQKKLFLLACFLCTGGLAVPSVFGKEPTKEELLEIMREAHKSGLWKPNITFASQKSKENDPIADAFERSNFLWDWIAIGILNTRRSDKIMSLPQRYLKQVEEILLQKDGESQLGTEMFSKDPVSEIIKRDVAQYVERCCHGDYLDKDEIPNLEAFLVFFHEKLSPFVGEKDCEFTKILDAFKSALLDFGNTVQKIRSAFEKKFEGEPDLKIFLPLMEAFKEKKEALLQIGDQPHPRYERTTFDYNDDIKNFLKRIEASEWMKKLNALRRMTAFKNFKPKDFKAEEEKAKENFGILGLDMNLVKYPNPFKSQKRREEVGKFLKEEAGWFEEEIRSAYKRIGNVTEENFIRSLELLYALTEAAWTCECFDPVSVVQTFKEDLLECDIEMLINENKPKPNDNKLHAGFERLRKEKNINTEAVEKSIYDTYGARFEDNVKKRFYAVATSLLELTDHRISFIKTVRKMEETDYEDGEAAYKDALKQVTEWRLKQEERVKQLKVAEGNFYNTFFGGKKKDWQGNYVATIGDTKQPKCLEILEERLKDYGLWEPIVRGKKADSEKPNVKEQNTVIEDKKQPETVKKEETIPQEYTQLSNEKELKKPTRTRRGKNDN